MVRTCRKIQRGNINCMSILNPSLIFCMHLNGNFAFTQFLGLFSSARFKLQLLFSSMKEFLDYSQSQLIGLKVLGILSNMQDIPLSILWWFEDRLRDAVLSNVLKIHDRTNMISLILAVLLILMSFQPSEC